MGCDRLTLEKSAAILAILTQFKSQKGFDELQIFGQGLIFFSHVKMEFQWIVLVGVTNQSRANSLTQSFNHHWYLSKNNAQE